MEEMFEPLRAMGFETLQEFEQITNSPESVSIRCFFFIPSLGISEADQDDQWADLA